MKATKYQIFLVFINEGDPQSYYGLRHHLKKYFKLDVDDPQVIHPALGQLESAEAIAEFDVESEGGVDSALFSHPDHGDMNFSEFESVIGIESVYHLGRGAVAFAIENLAELTHLSAENGCDRALRALTSLPIDSTAWTGAPRGFVFTNESKLQIRNLVIEAQDSVSRSKVSNFETGQALAYLRCVEILLDAPDPPKDEIWKLLNKGSILSSISSIFITIMQAFKG